MAAFLRFIAVRFGAAVVTVLLVSPIVFTLMERVSSNCVERYIAYKNTQGQIIAEEIRMGLDKPYIVRWLNWISGVFFRFDLGESCFWRVDVTQPIGDTMLISLALCLYALIVTYLISVPVGILSANLRGGWFDSSLRIIGYLGLAIPNFLLALVEMLLSTIWFGETLTGLFRDEYKDTPRSWAKFGDLMSRAWLPILILGRSATAIQLQTVRAPMCDEKDKIYIDLRTRVGNLALA